MLKEYELTREIFNSCSGNQMRDIFIEEIALDDGTLDAYVRGFISGEAVEIERADSADGRTVTFDITIANQHQRMTFCEI